MADTAVVMEEPDIPESKKRDYSEKDFGIEKRVRPRIFRIRQQGINSERVLVYNLKQAGFYEAHREFSSAPVRYARPDVWGYRPPMLFYSFEVKNSESERVMVPCWQIVKVADFMAGVVEFHRFPIVAAHIGKKKGKIWVYKLLTSEEIAAARNALHIFRAQEKLWREQGKKGKGLFKEASIYVMNLVRKGNKVALSTLGWKPDVKYQFWLVVPKSEKSSWSPNEDARTTMINRLGISPESADAMLKNIPPKPVFEELWASDIDASGGGVS